MPTFFSHLLFILFFFSNGAAGEGEGREGGRAISDYGYDFVLQLARIFFNRNFFVSSVAFQARAFAYRFKRNEQIPLAFSSIIAFFSATYRFPMNYDEF